MSEQTEVVRSTRLANFKKLLAALPQAERHVFSRHYDLLVEENEAAGDRSYDVDDGPLTDLADGRYFILYWQEYDDQFDEVNPDDWEFQTDSRQEARELVEQHVCRNEPSDYSYLCHVLDLDDGVELEWHEVREVRWGERPAE